MKRFILIALALTLLSATSTAAVPRTLNIQGVLADDSDLALPDGTYTVQFHLWNAITSGTDVWTEQFQVTQSNGVFNAVLGNVTTLDPALFEQTLWLSLVVDGGSPTSPRIEMTSVASALNAAAVAPDAAVRSLNGLTNNVLLQAGTNVSLAQIDSTIVISATAGGGDDGDWTITSGDIYRPTGRVYVGSSTPPLATGRGETNKALDPVSSKMTVVGTNEGFRSIMNYETGPGDGQAAIFARRQRVGNVNPGTAFGLDFTNNAIVGYNDWSESYTFGLAGYAWLDDSFSGAVLGSTWDGSLWTSLVYKDAGSRLWGVYTNAGIFAGTSVETSSLIASSLKLTSGASSGYLLTSDVSGNATWEAPSAAGADNDWVISGSNLVRSSTGTVAIGTTDAHNFGEIGLSSTVQVSAVAAPSLCLDTVTASLKRWSLVGSQSGLAIRRSTTYSGFGVRSVFFDEGLVDFYNAFDEPTITMRTGDSMTSGSALMLYGTSPSTSLAMIELDAQVNAGHIGGTLKLRDSLGQTEVVITGNHNNTAIGRVTTPVLEITGGSDLSEQFDMGDASALTKPGMVVSIDPTTPGKLTLSGGAYDRKVAGVISGAGGVNTGMVMGQKGSEADGEYPVALVGRVYVWADASNGPIAPGDLLTTAEMAGHAMKVTDHTLATGAILGKAMTGLNEGQGLILTLVSLQ
ncbi:MAG: hypothetical protein ACI9UQ_001077 [Candidatus Krumholzibacteriia bacterium]|jgi:hypothetical protein